MKYNSLRAEGHAEVVEKKSRFIGFAAPCDSEEKAREMLAAIKKKHYDAGHNVFCYRVGIEKEVLRFSDDGEPSGTGGAPLMEIINGEKYDLRNVLVVVTRYFGGTLLGTGGLVRCYGQAGKEAINAAGIVTYSMHRRISVKIGYPLHGKVEYVILQNGGVVESTDFSEHVTVNFLAEENACDAMVKKIVEITSDNATIQVGDAVFVGL